MAINNKIRLFAFIALSLSLGYIVLGCKSSNKNQTTSPISGIIDSFFPPKNKGIFPNELQIYVILNQKPDPQGVRFLVWRNGIQIPGKIIQEEIKEQGKYKVIFEPTEKEQGTYVVYFNYGVEAIFWTFWSEVTKTIPFFPQFSYPPHGSKNFPPGSSISISLRKAINPYTIDDETIRLIKLDISGEQDSIFDVSYLPNSLIWLPDRMEASSNYKAVITGIVPLSENSPSTIHYETGFRTQDLEKPSIVSCNPKFCTLSSCDEVKGEFFDMWIEFQKNEELLPQSVLDNFKVYVDLPSGTEIVDFSKVYVYDVFSRSLKLILEKNLAPKRSIIIYPNKIEVRFEDLLQPPSTVRIYILPTLSDSSGNQINDFFSWCIKVVP
jgi:hypothetical protein